MKKLSTILELVFLAGLTAQAFGLWQLYGWQAALTICGTEVIIVALAGAYFAIR